MKALVYHGPGQISLDERPVPELSFATDAIVRMRWSTICGTDLHIVKGDVPTCEPGRVLGHEGVGVVEKVGPSVTAFAPGDKVLISCITACGKCEACRRGMYSHCADGGWILGNRIDGTQAEYVRIPHADTSLYPVPADASEESLVMLSDVLPTGFECGVLNGKVSPGSTVAIIGAGPIGLASLLTARFYSPSSLIVIDPDPHRLEVARRLGATRCVPSDREDPVQAVMLETGYLGADRVIEAVGIPSTFELCQSVVAIGGTIANVGVHGAPAPLHLEKLWDRNLTITTRLVDTVSTPMLLKTVHAGTLDPQVLISHRFALAETLDAYDVFTRAAQTHAIKLLIDCRSDAAQ